MCASLCDINAASTFGKGSNFIWLKRSIINCDIIKLTIVPSAFGHAISAVVSSTYDKKPVSGFDGTTTAGLHIDFAINVKRAYAPIPTCGNVVPFPVIEYITSSGMIISCYAPSGFDVLCCAVSPNRPTTIIISFLGDHGGIVACETFDPKRYGYVF